MFIFPFPRGGGGLPLCDCCILVCQPSAPRTAPRMHWPSNHRRPRRLHPANHAALIGARHSPRRPARPPLAWLLDHGSYGPTWGRARLSARDIPRGATFNNRAAGPVHPLAPAPVPAPRLRQAYTGGLPDPVLHLSPGLRTRARPPRRTTAPGWGNAIPPTGPSPPPPSGTGRGGENGNNH